MDTQSKMKTWIQTEILCYEKQLADLGLSTADQWFPMCFDLEQLEAFKVYISESDEELTAIFLKSGESFVIKQKYHEFIRIVTENTR